MKRNKKSFVLITSLLVSTILIALTVAYVARVATEYKLMSKIYNATAALDLAEAGIDRALWEINYNGGTFSGWTTTIDGNGNQTSTVSVNSFKTLANDTMGDYTASIIIAADGMIATATSTGYVPNRTRYDEKRTVVVTYSRHNFGKAVQTSNNGPNSIQLSTQGDIDSYNSSNGTYAQTKSSYGDISTNGQITLGTQAKVWGDANPGPSYPFSTKPNVTGTWGTVQAPIVIDPIPNSALTAPATNDNGNIQKGGVNDPAPLNANNDLSVGTQKTITLPGGTYYFKSITLGTQATMILKGASTIYVDTGNVSVGTQANINFYNSLTSATFYVKGGNITVSTQGNVNNPGAPKNLMIYSSGANISLTTQTDMNAAIYAPNAYVSLTTQGDIFGSVVCNKFYSGTQAGVHYDQALAGVSPVFANNRVTSWQEIKQ